MKFRRIITTLLVSISLIELGTFTSQYMFNSGLVTVQAASTTKATLSRTIKGHIWSLKMPKGYPHIILFTAKDGTLGLAQSHSELQYMLNKKSRESFSISDFWRMNDSTDIAPGNKVLAFSNKYKINKGKLSCKLQLHFKGNKGNANGCFNFNISKLKRINSKYLQGRLSYLRTYKEIIKIVNGPRVKLTRID